MQNIPFKLEEAYTSPNGNEVDFSLPVGGIFFDLTGAYSPPNADAVDFSFGETGIVITPADAKARTYAIAITQVAITFDADNLRAKTQTDFRLWQIFPVYIDQIKAKSQAKKANLYTSQVFLNSDDGRLKTKVKAVEEQLPDWLLPRKDQAGLVISFAQGQYRHKRNINPWEKPERQDARKKLSWSMSEYKHARKKIPWTQNRRTDAKTEIVFEMAQRRDKRCELPAGQYIRTDVDIGLLFSMAEVLDRTWLIVSPIPHTLDIFTQIDWANFINLDARALLAIPTCYPLDRQRYAIRWGKVYYERICKRCYVPPACDEDIHFILDDPLIRALPKILEIWPPEELCG